MSNASNAEPGSSAGKSVLIIGREADERRKLSFLFGAHGFRVTEAGDTDEAEQLIRSADIDLVILDALPLEGGPLEFCRKAYVGGMPPIIILAESVGVVEEIVVLEVGADDLIEKPVDQRLLLARARALLRRCQRPGGPSGPIDTPLNGGWRLETSIRRAISPRGRSVILSPSDVQIFELFLRNPGVVFTQESGARALGVENCHSNLIRTAVSRLRRRLTAAGDGDPIRTVRGIGYVYGPARTLSGTAMNHLEPPSVHPGRRFA